MIKAILFDVHGTIIDKGKDKDKVLTIARNNVVSFLNRHGYKVTDSGYYQVWLHNLKKHRQEWEELNEVSFYDWYRGILSDLKIDRCDEKFIDEMSDQWIAGFSHSTTEISPAKEALTELKKDFLLGVVSNSMGKNTRIDLTITGFIDLFDAIIISSEVGKRKPHPFIFESALKRLEVKPSEAIFVGDDIYEDIYGAKQVGMKTILIANQDPLKYLSSSERSKILAKAKIEDNKPDATIDNMGSLAEALREEPFMF